MNAPLFLRLFSICCLGCLLVFSSIEFYLQPLPPSFGLFDPVYHLLHGTNPHPSLDRPFPKGEFRISDGSRKLDLGETNPTVYARLTSISFSESAEQVVVVFNGEIGHALPPISVLAPEPTLHAGNSVFPARSAHTNSVPGSEMEYTFEFPSINDIRDSSVHIYLNEKKAFSVSIENPTPAPVFWEERGTNVWGALVCLSVILIGVLWNAEDSSKKILSDLREEWSVTDSEREKITEMIRGADKPQALIERHKAAHESLSRAEGIILEFYEDKLRAQPRTILVSIALFFLCLLLLVPLIPVSTVTESWRPTTSLNMSSDVQIQQRLEILERGRHLPAFYLIIAISVGGAGVLGNLILSAWETKATARRMIRRRLESFDARFQDLLVQKVDEAERSLNELRAASSNLERRLEKQQEDLLDQQRSLTESVRKSVSNELDGIVGFVEDLKARASNKVPTKTNQSYEGTKI